MRRLPLVLAPLFLGAILLASCSSGSTSGSATTTSPNPAHPHDQGSATSAPTVSGGTDLTTEPVISAGSPPPPKTLVTKDLVVGTGRTATLADTVEVQYVGANYKDGKVFDSSWQYHQPATFALSGVVPGFAKGIEGMKVGGRREIVIPPALGYGASGQAPAVGPNETLVFVVDLLAIR